MNIFTSLLLNKYNNVIRLDTPEPWGLFFQDYATPQMEGLEELHNNVICYLAIILFAVNWIMLPIVIYYISSIIPDKYFNFWTFLSFKTYERSFLIMLIFGFLRFLYFSPEIFEPILIMFSEEMPQGEGLNTENAEAPTRRSWVSPSDRENRSSTDKSRHIVTSKDCRINSNTNTRGQLYYAGIFININPWAEFHHDPIQELDPELKNHPRIAYSYYFSVGNKTNGTVCFSSLNLNDSDIQNKIQEKTAIVENLGNQWDQNVTMNKLQEVKLIQQGNAGYPTLGKFNKTWKEEDPVGHKLLEEVRLLRAIESANRITNHSYNSRIARFPFEH